MSHWELRSPLPRADEHRLVHVFDVPGCTIILQKVRGERDVLSVLVPERAGRILQHAQMSHRSNTKHTSAATGQVVRLKCGLSCCRDGN